MASSRGPIVEETVVSAFTGEMVCLRRAADGSPICPICGLVWPPNAEHAWGSDDPSIKTEAGLLVVSPNWGICPCCNIGFGLEDIDHTGPGMALESAWAVLRERWLQKVGRSDAALGQVREHLGLDL